VRIGIAPSDLANELNPSFALPQNMDRLAQVMAGEGQGFELELEENLEIASLPELSVRPAFVGVHQPTTNIDVLSDDPIMRTESLTKIEKAMILADHVDAEYFTIHLETVDRNWADEEARGKKATLSREVFDELVELHKQRAFTFPMLIENLEYPKYPATPQEIKEVVDYLADVSIPTGIVMDVGHLWRSRSLMKEAGLKVPDGDLPYTDFLRQTLDSIGEHIRVFHVTGCGGHETHLLPDLSGMPQPSAIGKKEMLSDNTYNFRAIGATVLKFAADQPVPPRIINEAFGHPYRDVLQNNRDILNLNKEA
jgi:hypothetical protein